jgi:uncharacterized iron-regulated protein
MFERDVQPSVDSYLAGHTSEAEFLGASRPWPRYATDYRSLVELAKRASWPVVAANVPRRFASIIAKAGLPGVDQLLATDRALVARDLQCPLDAYFDRFAATMGAHPGSATGAQSPEQRATLEKYYASQCVKDETMAEAIAAASERQVAKGPVVHFTGAFHSDFGTGTAERVRRRLPGSRVAVLSMLPRESLDDITPAAEDLKRAEYLIYTTK